MVDGIPESSPVEEGQPGRNPWSCSSEDKEEELEHPLMSGKDRVAFTPPEQGVLGVFRSCLLRAVKESLGLSSLPELRSFSRGPLEEPALLAERLCSEVARALQIAIAAGMAQPEQALVRGAKTGTEQAVEILETLGMLEGSAGEVFESLLAEWGMRLQRLVASLDRP
ncbi:MAG: hypothetical protein ACE5F1_04110 [Planctomycetota bacterium]